MMIGHPLGQDGVHEMPAVDQPRFIEDLVVLGHQRRRVVREQPWVVNGLVLVNLEELRRDEAKRPSAEVHSW